MTTRLLIVDDDDLVLTGLAASLEDLGYQVSGANTGTAALEQLARDPVDAVIADMILGEMDGLELLRRIRARDPNIPVLILTGHGTAANAVEALRQGAADYIQKPARPDEIAQRVEAAIAAARLRHRLAAEREAARQEATIRETRAVRIERFEAALRLARGLAADLQGLIRLLEGLPAELVHAWPPEWREALNAGLDRLQTLRSVVTAPPETPETFDLCDALYAALDAPVIHHLRSARPGVILEVDRAPSPVRTSGHPALFRAALSPLVAAMLRALPSGGRLAIAIVEEEHVQPWGHLVQGASGNYGVVHLHTSARLTDEELDHFFEPYAVKSVISGDGFALTRILLCMRAHRGLSLVRLTPSPAGTEVRLLFPLAASSAPRPGPDSGSAQGTSARPRWRVLVVDDAPHHRRHAVELLRSLNCEPDEADSSATALRKISERCGGGAPYDLVLADLVLGEPTDGVDLLRQVIEFGRPCPVALMGGFADLARITEGRRAGALAYLRKPLTAEALEHTLDAAARLKAGENANPGD
ncbi:MAG: response regulator [Kiritimatiellae bacterium]|nr:response regulator [Kiritimatiellia bacterium]